MNVSLLQLNMNADAFWDSVIPYLTSHDFDVIHLQEVAGKHTKVGIIDTKRDCYEELQKILGEKYNSEFVLTDRFTSSPDAYFGNAIFYKKEYPLLQKHIEWSKKNEEPFSSDATTYENTGRALLHVTLSIAGKEVSFLTTHGAWAKTPKEEPHQTEQGKILLNYLKNVQQPFVFSGDLNLDPEQPTIAKIGELARNLTNDHHITNTLNPRTHYARARMFPPGVAVDYIFTSRDITVKSFNVLEEDISDHLGLVAEFEI
jgi:endonuclease/exonuclease/phosphatase family metal-dependent hydrolase